MTGALAEDTVFKDIAGGKIERYDKMRYLSKKELAKHRALTKNRDFVKFQAMDLKNENEIGLDDLTSDEEKDKVDDLKAQSDGEEDGIDDLYEFWVETDKKKAELLRERNPNIDTRLEEYLRSHSQQLSLKV